MNFFLLSETPKQTVNSPLELIHVKHHPWIDTVYIGELISVLVLVLA